MGKEGAGITSIDHIATYKCCRARISWRFKKCLYIGDFGQTIVEQQGHALAHTPGLEDIVGDKDDGDAAFLVEPQHQPFDQSDVGWVQVGGGFVQEKCIRAQDQRARASATRCASPPERVRAGSLAMCPNPTSSSAAWMALPWLWRPRRLRP